MQSTFDGNQKRKSFKSIEIPICQWLTWIKFDITSYRVLHLVLL